MVYKLELTEQDLKVLDASLGKLPYEVVASLMIKLNNQIIEQQKNNVQPIVQT